MSTGSNSLMADTEWYREYRNWNLFKQSDKVLALRDSLGAPCVHKSFVGIDAVGFRMAETQVMEKIDEIENEGFDAYMDREFQEWRKG